MNPTGVNIIKASAGSGKTYALARTYIANLIGVPIGTKTDGEGNKISCFKIRQVLDYHRHILAITFTNKATNEMKERIIIQLYKLGKGEGDYVDDFKIMFPNNSIDEVEQAARRALSAILFDYGAFNVSTIDSFFQGILRNFARELDRDYNYDLELDEDYATGVAVHDFLADLGGVDKKHGAINEWVKEYIRDNISNKKTWNFFGKSSSDNLRKFAKIIYKEFFREHHQEVVSYLSDIGSGNGNSNVLQFKKQLLQRKLLRENSYKDSQNAIKEFLEHCGIEPACVNRRSPMHKICSGDMSPFDNKSSVKTLISYSQEDDALKNRVLLKAYRERPGFVDDKKCETFRKLLQETFEHYNLMVFLKNVIDNIWYLGLLGKIDEKLVQYRMDTNSIMIADTNELISKALDCGASFIYEHAGTVFNNYMIDEFQDTSRKQYNNFKPLLEESIARANSNLIIGDEKQSIYRFRNSDPSMLRDELEKDLSSTTAHLDTNYRSFPAIVNFNNALFNAVIGDYKKDLPKYSSLCLTYKNISQKQFKNDKDGFVTINVVPYKGGNEKGMRRQIITVLPDFINSLRRRGFAMKDIALLVNTRKEGNEIVEYLLEYNDSLGSDSHPNHIDIISSESLLLKNSPSIRMIISVLRFLELSQYQLDDIDKDDSSADDSPIAYFLKKRVSEQRLYKILHDFEAVIQFVDQKCDTGNILLDCFENDFVENESLTIEQRLDLYNKIAQEVMPDPTCQLTSLVNIVDKIIAKYILPSQGSSNLKIENSFLMAFMNVVLDFTRQHNGGTVREFLQFWDDKCDKIAVSSPADANAVNVMTIHKSKGLEFKCVIVPFADWDLITADKIFCIKRDEWIIAGPIEDIGSTNKDVVPPLIPVNPDILRSASLLDDVLDEEEEKSLIDNMNKLYVALTRPKEELHVFAPVKEKEMDNHPMLNAINGVGQLLYIFALRDEATDLGIKENDKPFAGLLNEDGDTNPIDWKVITYSMGAPSVDVAQVDQEEDAVHHMSNYYVSSTAMPVHISIPDASGSLKDEGVRMHELLALVKTAKDFDHALAYGIINGLFNDSDYWNENQFRELINTIKHDEMLMEWFDECNVVYNERNISYPHTQDSDEHDHRRPDRLICRPNGEMIVVDYKFGLKTDDKTINVHKSKVSQYVTLLKQMGYEKVTGYIWYVRSNKIVNVPDDK